MSILDDLRRMYGMGGAEDPQLQAMLAAEPPSFIDQGPPGMTPGGLDPATMAAQAPQPSAPAGGGLGHPSVLNFLKELESSGRLTGGDKGPEKPKGMNASQTTIKSEQGGVPADVRAQGVAVRGQAELDDAAAQRDARLKQADELEQRAAYLRQDAAVEAEARQKQEQELAAKQERLRGQQMELAKQADEPVNPNRYLENKSLLGKASAVISAAIYGYLGGRGQPPVMESLMQMAQADTQAQIVNNAASRDKRNTLISQYERQYGDSTLVAKRLEADKLLEMSKIAKAESMDAKSQEAKAAAEDLQRKLQGRVGVLHKEIQEATYGKPVEVTTTYQAPKPGAGAPDMAARLKKAADLNKSLAEAGATPQERVAMLKAAGLPPIEGQTMGEQKFAADRETADRKARELSPEEKTDLRKRTDGLAEMVQGMKELDDSVGFKRGADGEVISADDAKLSGAIRGTAGQVAQSFSNSLPFGMHRGAGEMLQKLQPEESKALDRARDKIVFGQAKAEGAGALGDTERESYRQRIPTDSPLSVQRASAQIWRTRKQQYENLVGQYGKAAVDEMLRARGINPAEVGG